MDPFNSFFFVLLSLLFGCGLSGLAVVCYCFWCPDHFFPAPAPAPALDFVLDLPPHRFIVRAAVPAVVRPRHFPPLIPRPYPAPATVLGAPVISI